MMRVCRSTVRQRQAGPCPTIDLVTTASAAPPARLTVPRASSLDPTDRLAARLREIRDQLQIPAVFPPPVVAEAVSAAATVSLPEADLTALPFVTIDPAGSTDLDQALHIERAADGFRVRYAIADVPAFVRVGGAVDIEARSRGQTLYAPDGRVPLHPTVLSEGAASLLADQVRAAFVWTFELDARGVVASTTLVRARVRSVRKYSYDEAQHEIDTGTAPESLALLPLVGSARVALERERGGASLDRPEEEVTVVDGVYRLERRTPLPVESFNAQLSLMTGIAAAGIMLEGRIGILRTMPVPTTDAFERFRSRVAAIGCPWPETQGYGEYLRALDRDSPAGLAALQAAGSLFRGAGYTAFDGEAPSNPIQSAIGAPYAHTTAPLRRLVDRFVLVACEALAAGAPVPGWVRDALPTLPAIMARSASLAAELDRACVDAIEAALLVDRVGDDFGVTVLTQKPGGGTVQLTDPFIVAPVVGDVRAGQRIRVTLGRADIETGTVEFIAPGGSGGIW